MKKIAAIVFLFLFALMLWNMFAWSGDMAFHVDGDEIDGPLEALLGMLFAGGGMLVAGVVMLMVGSILAVVFAGVGILCVGGLLLGALLVALVVSPLLLPLLVPVAIVWWLVSRSRRNRLLQQPV
ncbi:hypothetical protein [uncultured Massilia sp.]|uniref:hypothetical protein n=1 Tax=uncultured Massilia sp. TaxID=169973 RepID=UPI0025EF0195|nr:hypothetical protein [uncultured Massilia sp.]